MLDAESYGALKESISLQILRDQRILNDLRDEVKILKSAVRRILPRSTTSISLVAADGGDNSIQFDPFLIQLVRVVDSSNNEYCLEAITPTTSVTELSRAQFEGSGSPVTPLGRMMDYLGVRELSTLSHMIRRNDDDRPTSPSWVQVYRELMEWAVLFDVIRHKDFGTDTIIVVDGLLRSKVFAGNLFASLSVGFKEAIDRHLQLHRRRVYVVGIAKHSKVLDRYRLAMALENILTTNYPAFVPVPREMEERAYIWSEYARGDDRALEGGEVNKFVAGKMFLVKFGPRTQDPIWPVDIFLPQVDEASTIIGYLLSDAIDGFPVPCYPRCLQKAHEHAALVDFDFQILQDEVFHHLRAVLGPQQNKLDEFRLRDVDPAQRRY